MLCTFRTNAAASAAECMSGSVMISMRGVPTRLKSRRLIESEDIVDLAVSCSICICFTRTYSFSLVRAPSSGPRVRLPLVAYESMERE